MTAQPSWIEQAVPAPYRLFRCDLRTLTFGHVMLLDRFELDPVTDLTELLMAVQIVSRSYADAIQWVTDTMNTRRGLLRMRLWQWRIGKIDIVRALTVWNEYLAVNAHAPEVTLPQNKSNGHSRVTGTPQLQQVRHVLLSALGYRPETIMDAPYAQAMWDFYAHAEAMGSCVITGDKHREIREQLEALEKEKEQHVAV